MHFFFLHLYKTLKAKTGLLFFKRFVVLAFFFFFLKIIIYLPVYNSDRTTPHREILQTEADSVSKINTYHQVTITCNTELQITMGLN